MNGKIEIVMRKIESSGSISETVLVTLSNAEHAQISGYLSDILAFPGLELRLKEQTVYLDHTLIPMTYHEFFTLACLAQHPGWVFSKEQIYEEVWKESGTNCRAAVTNVVSQIRRKIGEGYIKTIVGSGYKFEA